jgi:hypothetical protein
MKRILGIVVLVAILALILNDGGRWFNAKSQLRTATSELSGWASTSARVVGRDKAAQELVNQATIRGVRVSQYGQDDNGIQIWTEQDVRGTWLLGPYIALSKGVPANQAMGHAFVVHDYAQAQYR